MKINPCKSEMLAELLFWPLWVIAIIVTCSKWHWNLFITISLFAILVALLMKAIMNYIYLGREIIFTSEGCTFSILGRQNVYGWKNLKVQVCEKQRNASMSNDVSGPGIMIYDSTLEIPEKKAGPSFCRRYHPMRSVFIRFRSKADDIRNTKDAPRSATYGYVAEKDEILNYLKSIGAL